MKRVLLVTVFLVFTLSCGSPLSAEKSRDSGKGYTVKTIEGCEYIEVYFAIGSTNGYYSLTHKGNCKNPAHTCPQPEPAESPIMLH